MHYEDYKEMLTGEFMEYVASAKEKGETLITQLEFINRRSKELYAAATPDVKAEVEAYIKKLKEEGEEGPVEGDTVNAALRQ